MQFISEPRFIQLTDFRYDGRTRIRRLGMRADNGINKSTFGF